MDYNQAEIVWNVYKTDTRQSGFVLNVVCVLCLCVAGGRGKDGAPIITFPEYSGFSEVPEDDFLNVVTYLTSIPRYTHTHTPNTVTLAC